MVGGLFDPDDRIAQAVEGFRAVDGGGRVLGLVGFGEGVEQAPKVARQEGVVPGLAPFV